MAHFGVDDFTLHNSHMVQELSRILLHPWDVEERQSCSMEDVVSSLFPVLVRVSLSYSFFLCLLDKCFRLTNLVLFYHVAHQ